MNVCELAMLVLRFLLFWGILYVKFNVFFDHYVCTTAVLHIIMILSNYVIIFNTSVLLDIEVI